MASQYENLVIAFGLTNTPAIFHGLVNDVLTSIPKQPDGED